MGSAASVAALDPPVARGLYGVAVQRHRLHAAGHRFERHVIHVRKAQRHHDARLPFAQRAHRRGAEAHRRQTVERGGAAAAQQVAQHHHTGVLAGASVDGLAHALADAAQALGVADLGGFGHLTVAVHRLGAFGHHDDGVGVAFDVARHHLGRHLVDVERDLGQQHRVRVAGDAGVQRDPAGVAAHHLHHHHALVALGGAVQAVQAFGGEGHGGVEAEGGEGLVEVVVDGLGHTHHAQAFLVQRVGDGERAVAADGHQRIEFLHREVLQDFVRAVHIPGAAIGHLHREVQWVAPVGGAQDGAAQVRYAAHPVFGEAEHPALGVAFGKQDAVETVADAVALPAAVDGGHHHGADHRVEAGRVAATGADGDAADGVGHGVLLIRFKFGPARRVRAPGAAPWPPGCGAAGKHRACPSPAAAAGTGGRRRSRRCRRAR